MQSAEIVFLDEIFGPDIDFVGRYIRVTGTILHLFEMERYCEISFKNNTLYIDLSITDMIGMKVGTLFQFIGEIMDYRTSLKVLKIFSTLYFCKYIILCLCFIVF